MTNRDAYRRAWAAVCKADKETDGFEHGGMASGELLLVLRDYLRKEFGQ